MRSLMWQRTLHTRRRELLALAVGAMIVLLLATTTRNNTPSCFKNDRVIRIMPLGDSITSSVYPPAKSYRYFLWQLLQKLKLKDVSFDFVGSMRGTYQEKVPVGEETAEWKEAFGDADMDHEGHWGWRIEQVTEHISEWLETHKPHVVLLHLGTNNLPNVDDVGPSVGLLSSLVDAIRGHPQGRGVKLLVAKLIHSNTQHLSNDDINRYNEGVEQAMKAKMAAQKAEPMSGVCEGFDIEVVDLFSVVSEPADFHDHVHPSNRGEEKMALGWFTSLTHSDWFKVLLKDHPQMY